MRLLCHLPKHARCEGRTENIDSHYRDLIQKGLKYQGTGGVEIAIPPLAKSPPIGAGVLSLANYKRALRRILQKEFPSREEWVKAAARTPTEAKYLGLCESLVGVKDWDVELIETRSRRLAELAWGQLAPWLDISTAPGLNGG